MNDFGVAVTLASAADIATSSGDKGERVMVMNPVQHRGWAQRREHIQPHRICLHPSQT